MLTFLALLFIGFLYLFLGIPKPDVRLEWVIGLQGMLSILCLLIAWWNIRWRKEARETLSRNTSPLFGDLDYPRHPLFCISLPLVALASFIPPILFDGGLWLDLKGEIALHLFLIALFLDILSWMGRKKSLPTPLGEEKDLSIYKDEVDGALEAALKGVEGFHLTQAGRALSLLPSSFSIQVSDLEYRALYLFDGMETLANRAAERGLFAYAQAVLGRMLRLSGSLLPQFSSLATSGLEGVSRAIRKQIDEGHPQTGERALFLLVQSVREIDPTSPGLGDYLIRTCLELEKGLQSLFKNDKERPIKSLLVPLAELKKVLQSDPFVKQPATDLGLRELDRVVQGFMTLESVMTSLSILPPAQSKEGEKT